ncbi:MAG TPA: biopolymer transporter ExbD [Kofleriaceae bacterium]|jgi:biopolymer transport protein ExbD
MAQALGTGDKKSRNVDLNIVPFIDLMSCLTAFLLVAAAWVATAQLELKPAGKARDGLKPCEETGDCIALSVLIESDAITVGESRVNEFTRVPVTSSGYDYAQLETVLRKYRGASEFTGKLDIEIAAESTAAHPVAYQALVATMDTAVKSGFPDVKLTDAGGLAARPTL